MIERFLDVIKEKADEIVYLMIAPVRFLFLKSVEFLCLYKLKFGIELLDLQVIQLIADIFTRIIYIAVQAISYNMSMIWFLFMSALLTLPSLAKKLLPFILNYINMWTDIFLKIPLSIIKNIKTWMYLTAEQKNWQRLHTPRNFSPEEMSYVRKYFELKWFLHNEHNLHQALFKRMGGGENWQKVLASSTRTWVTFAEQVVSSLRNGEFKGLIKSMNTASNWQELAVNSAITLVILAGVVAVMAVREKRKEGFNNGIFFNELDWEAVKYNFFRFERWMDWISTYRIDFSGRLPSDRDGEYALLFEQNQTPLGIYHYWHNTKIYYKEVLPREGIVCPADLEFVKKIEKLEQKWIDAGIHEWNWIPVDKYGPGIPLQGDCTVMSAWGDMILNYFIVYPINFCFLVEYWAFGFAVGDVIHPNWLPYHTGPAWAWFCQQLYLF